MAQKTLHFKIQTFVNQNLGPKGEFYQMLEVPVLVKDEQTQESKIEKYTVWIFEDL